MDRRTVITTMNDYHILANYCDALGVRHHFTGLCLWVDDELTDKEYDQAKKDFGISYSVKKARCFWRATDELCRDYKRALVSGEAV